MTRVHPFYFYGYYRKTKIESVDLETDEVTTCTLLSIDTSPTTEK